MTESKPGMKRVLVVDRQEYWRGLSAEALTGKGFAVKVLDRYEYSPDVAYFEGKPPDLVVLGCASIKREEREFIEAVLADGPRLLVFCASLPWPDARSVFLAGADDVTEKPYNPERVVSTVEEVFESRWARDSYEAVESEGVL